MIVTDWIGIDTIAIGMTVMIGDILLLSQGKHIGKACMELVDR
jgi:hypothetical protein